MRKLIFILLVLISMGSKGQDPQFSQYYSAPLILNPAFAGATECYRASLNSRAQWIGLNRPFYTIAASLDMNYADLNSGFGIMALHDNVGVPLLSSSEIHGYYSFIAPFHEQFNVRFGLEAAYVNRSIDYSRLLFEDQFTGIQVTQGRTDDPVSYHDNVHYADFSAGMLIFGEDRYWLGFSAHHLNRPEQAFFLDGSRLPIKYSVHGGINIFFRQHIMDKYHEMARLVPTFNYKREIGFDQLDLGVYYVKFPVSVGLWYRGILTKEFEGIRNNDALVLQASYTWNDLTFGYSFDFTTSKLRMANTFGSHEISVTYLFCADWPRRKRPPRKHRKLPCPDAIRSTKYKGNGQGF